MSNACERQATKSQGIPANDMQTPRLVMQGKKSLDLKIITSQWMSTVMLEHVICSMLDGRYTVDQSAAFDRFLAE